MFVTTAEVAHISRASELLHITQPALSRALAEFEAQVGVRLLSRSTRRVALTPEGERFLPVAQRLLWDLDRAVDELRAGREGITGRVVLVVGSAFGTCLLPGILKRFRAQAPGIEVRVIDDNSAGITRRVAGGEADLGIGTPIGDTSRLHLQPLLKADLGLLGDPERYPLTGPATPEHIQGLPLLKEPADTSILHRLQAQGSEVVAQMQGGIEVSSLALQLAMAQAGLGVAVLSALGAANPAAQGLRFVALQPVIQRELFLMTPRQPPPAPAALALRTALLSGLDEAHLPQGVARVQAQPPTPTRSVAV